MSEPSRTALITGGTSGLGLACARALLQSAEHAWKLVIIGRNRRAGQAAEAALNRIRPDSTRFISVDLGSLLSIRQLGVQLRDELVRLDALICNAGVQLATHNERTADGYEAVFGINHLGHFLLVQSLASLLNEHARIVIVSSSTHDPTQRTGMPAPRWVEPELLARPEADSQKTFEGQDAAPLVHRRRYTTSKLCNLYFAYELERRIKSGQLAIPSSATVVAFDPGLMPGTGLGRDFSPPQRFVWRHVLPVLRPVLKKAFGNVHTPEESGAALARLVDSPQFAGASGKYFQQCEPVESSPESYDAARAGALWAASERLTGFDIHRPPLSGPS